MFLFSIKLKKEACFFASLFFAFFSCEKSVEKAEKDFFPEVQSAYFIDLDSCILFVHKIQTARNTEEMKTSFLRARTFFKRLEPVMAFVENENYNTLNQPNLLQVEEEDLTDIKILQPQGFQVLEENIFTTDPDTSGVHDKAFFVEKRLRLIKSNTDFSSYKPYHFLWLLRSAFIRVAFTGITGFDSPVLQNSISEAKTVYQSMADYLAIFKDNFADKSLYQKWVEEIKASEADLSGDFDSFDRYAFIKDHTQKQMDLWNATVADWQVKFPFALAIKNDAPDLFSRSTFNMDFFSDRPSSAFNKKTIDLGKKLFYDANLSGDGRMSCSTCHLPQLAFTDGKRKAIGNKGQELLRNTPTLTYVAYQQGFFYDKRSGSLEGQVMHVANEANEFHTDMKTLTKTVKSNPEYRTEFGSIYKDSVSERNIRHAIATYIRSLATFNSKFDRNVVGKENTLTAEEIQGANLFMGKAACATCHFAPLFNGTVPPNFTESEMEMLGVPASAENEVLDGDPGRYNVFHTEEKKHFFKTPTIRNIERTAPYMHNGVYNSLKEVLDFYNVGGGAGLGFDVPLQTLPADSLNLTNEEQQAIIAFMTTLTDSTKVDERLIASEF